MPIDNDSAPEALVLQREQGPPGRADEAGTEVIQGSCGTRSDPAIAAYVVASRPSFDGLRQAAGQLAGLLVLAASGCKSIAPDHAILVAARLAHKEASENLRRMRAPEPARVQHRYATRASELIGIALEYCKGDIATYAVAGSDIEALGALRAGYACLQRAAAFLPGIELLGFSQGCCGSHPAVSGRNSRYLRFTT